jgi:solute carrier family 25 folate transporter 32
MADQSTQSSSKPSSPQHPKSTPINPLTSFIAGIAGGSASTILLYPLDLVKVRLQVDERAAQASNDPAQTRGRTICTTVRGVIKHEGYAGLYRGMTPAIIGSAASWGGFFIIYEELKRQMLLRKMKNADVILHNSPISMEEYDVSKDMHVDEEMDVNSNTESFRNDKSVITTQPHVKLGPMEHFTASCMAGACMVALTNPLWLIKTRLQLQNSRLQEQLSHTNHSSKPNASIKPPYQSLTHALITITKEEGFLSLYKGSIPALMLVSHGGIQFVSYEFLKSRFAKPEWKKSSGKNKGTIVERLSDSLGYLIMGATSKL